MYFKAVIFCASALLIQTISGQCGCNPNIIVAPPCGCPNAVRYATPYAASLSISPCQLPGAPNIPAGMAIASDNLLIAGPVIVAGKLPFAGTVALEGALPAYGAGSVSYGCGDAIAIVTEVPYATGIAGPGIGYVGGSCGCGGIIY